MVTQMADSVPRSMQLIEQSAVTFEALAPDDNRTVKTRRLTMSPLYSGAPVETSWGRMVVDLAGMQVPDEVPVLKSHDHDSVVGYGKADNNGKRLALDGQAITAMGSVADILAAADGGFKWQASMGFDIHKINLVDGDFKEEINGREFQGPGLVVSKSRLREGSVVSVGADGNTSSRMFAAGDGGSITVDRENYMSGNANVDPVAEFAAKHADTVSQWKEDAGKAGVEEGRKAAATEERERFSALSAKWPDRPQFVAAQFAKGHDVAAACVEFADIAAVELKAANEQLAAKTPAVNYAEGKPGTAAAAPEELPTDPTERAAVMWKANTDKVRDEFSSVENLAAYLKHEAA